MIWLYLSKTLHKVTKNHNNVINLPVSTVEPETIDNIDNLSIVSGSTTNNLSLRERESHDISM